MLRLHTDHFPVGVQAFLSVQDVVDPASVSLQWDLTSLLTRTLVLTGWENQVLLPAFFIFHHPVKGEHRETDNQGKGRAGVRTSEMPSIHRNAKLKKDLIEMPRIRRNV